MSAPVLYAHPLSSYCQKVLVGLYEKQAPFELRLLSSETPDAGAELRELWPLEKFPVLKTADRTLLESSVIIEWVDLAHPSDAPLIPKRPDAALQVRMYDRIFDNYVMTPMQTVVFDHIRPPDQKDTYGTAAARSLLDRAYAWLDEELAGRTWAAGEAFTLADCAAAPALLYADWVHRIEGRPHLSAYLRRLRERPSFARAVDEARPYRHLFPPGVPADRD